MNFVRNEPVEVMAVTLPQPVEARTIENLSLETLIDLAALLRSDEHVNATDHG